MKIAIASDHAGYNKKEDIKRMLLKEKIEIIDCGTDSNKSTDFPVYAEKLGEKVLKKEVDFGIALCKTGIGMSIALNKITGIMCAKVSNKEEAKLTKEHNHANVLAINSSISIRKIKNMLKAYINAKELTDEKYLRRIEQIRTLEAKHEL